MCYLTVNSYLSETLLSAIVCFVHKKFLQRLVSIPFVKKFDPFYKNQTNT